MSRELLSYLDCSGPEYAYLGHFRRYEYLEQGHNDFDDPEPTYSASFDRGPRVGLQNDQATVPGFKVNPAARDAFTPYDPAAIAPFNRMGGSR